MDIRQIHEEPPVSDNYLQSLYDLNWEQVKLYKEIEGLPNAPIQINDPKSQVFLKDFIGRVTEELIEGYQSTDEAVTLIRGKGWNYELLSHEEEMQLLNHLANANEEQADALGFFLTLLVYSNILAEDILSYKEKHSLDGVILEGLIPIVKQENLYQQKKNFYPLISQDKTPDYYKVIRYTPGFNLMGERGHELEKIQLFDIIYQLNIARNLLKSRPWKQTQVMTKELDYQEALTKAFYQYMGFLGINGFTETNLYRLFFLKQRLNLWRINTNY